MTWKFDRVAGPYKGRTGGLAWDGKGMLFSTVGEERVMRYDPATGKAGLFRKVTGRANGLAIAADGSVFAAQEGGRRVIRFMKDGSTAAMPDQLDGRHHNQPTDVIVDSKGRVWLTDPYNGTPPYGPPVYPFLDHASVLRLEPDGPAWKLRRVTHDTHGPRAVLLSKDEKTLFVADGDAERGDMCQLLSYPVKPDGNLGASHVLLVFAPAERGIEGMCLDADGDILACAGWKKGGNGPSIYVISPAGTILEAHSAPADLPMRCAFGDNGLSNLYLTAGDGGLYRTASTGRRGLPR
jgi:gluconolactonase